MGRELERTSCRSEDSDTNQRTNYREGQRFVWSVVYDKHVLRTPAGNRKLRLAKNEVP